MKLTADVSEADSSPSPRPTTGSGRSGVKLGIVRLGKAGGKVGGVKSTFLSNFTYREDTEHLYHAFVYSPVSFQYLSITCNPFIACYIRIVFPE